MVNVGRGFIGEVARIDRRRLENFWKGAEPGAGKAFEELVEQLTPQTPKPQRGPLRRLIANQLQDLSKQPGWNTFGMKSGTSDGQRWVGPKMLNEAGKETYLGTVPSDTLKALSDGLDFLGWDEIDELLSSPALKQYWIQPEGFAQLPVYKQRPILEKALRDISKYSEGDKLVAAEVERLRFSPLLRDWKLPPKFLKLPLVQQRQILNEAKNQSQKLVAAELVQLQRHQLFKGQTLPAEWSWQASPSLLKKINTLLCSSFFDTWTLPEEFPNQVWRLWVIMDRALAEGS